MFLISLFFVSLTSFASNQGHHGMVLFGEQSLYTSHLPLFHQPHNFQLVLEVNLEETHADSSTLEAYQQKKEEGQVLFTILPEAFATDQVVNGNITELQATLFSGHFEQGGEALGLVKMKIKGVVLYSEIKTDQNSELTEFKVFGQNEDYYMIHTIKTAPSYDMVLKVKIEEKPCSPRATNCLPPLIFDSATCIPTRASNCLPTISPMAIKYNIISLYSRSPDYRLQAPSIGDVFKAEFISEITVLDEIYSNYDELK